MYRSSGVDQEHPDGSGNPPPAPGETVRAPQIRVRWGERTGLEEYALRHEKRRTRFSRVGAISHGLPASSIHPGSHRPPSSCPRFVRFSEDGAQMIECRFVHAACSGYGGVPRALGLGGEPDKAPTATRQKLTAHVESRLEVRRRDLAGSCNVRESAGVRHEHTDGSGKPPALRAKPPVHRENQ